MVTPRTLRCANATLYACFTLIVWLAAVFVAVTRDYGITGYIGEAFVCLVSLVWGGYYMTLRYVVDRHGISRRLPFSTQSIRWKDLTCAELRKTCTAEIASATLHLETATGVMDLGSDLLSLDAVEGLAQDLSAAGLLTAPLPPAEED